MRLPTATAARAAAALLCVAAASAAEGGGAAAADGGTCDAAAQAAGGGSCAGGTGAAGEVLGGFGGGSVRTIDEDIHWNCPAVFGERFGRPVLRTFFTALARLYSLADRLSTAALGKELLTQGWADDYTAASYMFVVRMTMGMYSARDKTYMNVPTLVAQNESLRVGNVFAPHYDVDGYPNFLWLEKYTPSFLVKPLYVPALTCFYNGLRELPFEDDANATGLNTWDVVLQGKKFSTKKDWLLAFYDNVKSWSRDPTWPPQRVDYRGLFRKKDEWDDGLEAALTFGGIGAHRVEVVAKDFAGEVLPFVVKLNEFAAFETRPHWGKYGGDLYFTAEGLPAMIELADGRQVKRGDKDWQYWKFVWRSSLITVITLCDHLHFTHFKISNMLARGTRLALAPDNPVRRIFSIFSFGAIFVNLQAQFTLTGPDMLLHRATPFKDFAMLAEAVPAMLPDILDMRGIKELLDEELFKALPTKLQEAPYFVDGKLVMGAFKKLADQFLSTVIPNACKDGIIDDPDLKKFQGILRSQASEAHYKVPGYYASDKKDAVKCSMMVKRFAAHMYVVTAWHQQVGFVGDHYADPELAMMAWVDGELSARPRQSVIVSIINVFTSTRQPPLLDNYTHLFAGIPEEARLTELWNGFLDDLRSIKKEIDERNKKRSIPFYNMDPTILESSVAK